jgi:hypothetical protein
MEGFRLRVSFTQSQRDPIMRTGKDLNPGESGDITRFSLFLLKLSRYRFYFGLDFQLLSEGFRMFEVFTVRSSFVYSTKIFEKTVGVETFALKFINN